MRVKDLKACNSSVKIGCHGEKFAVNLLGGKILYHAGHDVDHPTLGKIEVKTSYVSSTNTFQFCLRKADKFCKTDVSHADYLVLVCLSLYGDKVYLIPSKDVPTGKKISLSVNSKRFAQFRIL